MKTAATYVLFFATALAVGAQQSSIDAVKLEQLRKMTPEERAKLKARLEDLKKLPAVEKERLKDNLRKIKDMSPEEVKKVREKAKGFSREEQKDYTELASGFFRWAYPRGYAEAFPRGVFFAWLKAEKPEKIAEIRAMEPGVGSPRVDAFTKLYFEFKDVMFARTEQHLKKHKCADIEALHGLSDATHAEFWPRWQELMQNCQGRKSNPGPVAPRPVDPKRK